MRSLSFRLLARGFRTTTQPNLVHIVASEDAVVSEQATVLPVRQAELAFAEGELTELATRSVRQAELAFAEGELTVHPAGVVVADERGIQRVEEALVHGCVVGQERSDQA